MKLAEQEQLKYSIKRTKKLLRKSKLNKFEAFKNAGMRLTGSGSFAECFCYGNYAIKIFSPEQDEAYYSYLMKIKGLDNPYVPKIYSIDSVKIGKLEYLIVVMELLCEEYNLSRAEIMKCYQEHTWDKDYLPLIFHSYNFNKKLKYTNEKLNELLKIIGDLIKDGFANDISGRNILYRLENDGTYTPVFTDPIWTGDPI